MLVSIWKAHLSRNCLYSQPKANGSLFLVWKMLNFDSDFYATPTSGCWADWDEWEGGQNNWEAFAGRRLHQHRLKWQQLLAKLPLVGAALLLPSFLIWLHLFFPQPICLHRNMTGTWPQRGWFWRWYILWAGLNHLICGLGGLVVWWWWSGCSRVRGQLFNRCSHSSFLFHILTRAQNPNRATNLDWNNYSAPLSTSPHHQNTKQHQSK